MSSCCMPAEKRIGYRNSTSLPSSLNMRRTGICIGNGEAALDRVVNVGTHIAGVGSRCLHAPVAGRGRTQRFPQDASACAIADLTSKSIRHALRSSAIDSELESFRKPALDAEISGRVVVLADHRRELFVASLPIRSPEQFFPRAARPENRPRQPGPASADCFR